MALSPYAGASGNNASSSHYTNSPFTSSPSTASAKPGQQEPVEIKPPDHGAQPDARLRGLNKGGEHGPCLVYVLAPDSDYHVLDLKQTKAVNKRWPPSMLEEKIRQAPLTRTFPETDYAATRRFVEAAKKKAEQEAADAAKAAAEGAQPAQPDRNAYMGTKKGNFKDFLNKTPWRHSQRAQRTTSASP